ncbi:hypothetical protein [Ferrimicrobium acidiphilum]|uniref:hypothetical protein n=1 Tax=Ferrimicrobium acidiphilum TaxID=121039 RepID=UPI0023F4D39E|nr:hypothetical protein [Ferrimicrobium acidiphilum]
MPPTTVVARGTLGTGLGPAQRSWLGFDDEPSADEFADCDALLTRGAMPTDPNSSHEGLTLRAALLSKRSLSARIALIDGDLPTWLGSWDPEGRESTRTTTSSIGKSPTSI